MQLTRKAIREQVRAKMYAWPGGYPLAMVMVDGELLCPKCVAENITTIETSLRRSRRGWPIDDWTPAGFDIQWEHGVDGPEYCAHCNAEIEVAYCKK